MLKLTENIIYSFWNLKKHIRKGIILSIVFYNFLEDIRLWTFVSMTKALETTHYFQESNIYLKNFIIWVLRLTNSSRVI